MHGDHAVSDPAAPSETLADRPAADTQDVGDQDAADTVAFFSLTDDQVAVLGSRAEACHFEPGESLIDTGQKGYPFYVVRSGRVLIRDETGDTPQVVAEHGPGCFIGDVDLLTGRPAVISAVAAEPTDAWCIRADRFLAALADLPWLAGTLFDAFARRRELLESRGFIGTRLIARTRDPDALRLREFFYKNNVPFTFSDCDEEDGQALLSRHGHEAHATPLIVCRGHVVARPSLSQVAECLGIQRKAPTEVIDLLIIGAGPAGLAAAIYAGSEGLSTLVLDRVGPGGQAGSSSRIENYMGFISGLSGRDLASRGYLQALRFGVRFTAPAEAETIETDEHGLHHVRLCTGESVACRTVLVATGVRYRQLGLFGVERFDNAGVYYAATTVESRLCRQATAVVVGAGNSAGQAAMFLALSAKRVLLVVRGNDLRKSMSLYLAERLEQTGNIEIRLETEVVAVEGADAVEAVTLRHRHREAEETTDCAGLFIFVGAEPHTGWLAGQVALDEKGFILTGPDLRRPDPWPLDREPCPLESSRPGLFAAGDVRSRTTKRVAFAVGDGALAVTCVHQYLSQLY